MLEKGMPTMSIRPEMQLILGLTDLQVRNGEIVDPRFVCCSADPDKRYIWNSDDPVPLPDVPDINDVDLKEHSYWFVESVASKITIREYLTHYENAEPVRTQHWIDAWHWNDEYGCGNVCGWSIGSTGVDRSITDILYSLALLHPEYANRGYAVLPSLNAYDSQHKTAGKSDISVEAQSLAFVRNLVAQQGRGGVRFLLNWYRNAPDDAQHKQRRYALLQAARTNRLIRRGHNVAGFSLQMRNYLSVARWLFRQAGFDVTVEDLKLMLYWQWS